ncbi:glycosyltransferase family 4 protein [Sphingomonas yantingensis]|uniref:Alpha-1,3-mannosyltransferase n=1 Tax=Sphingomonas yantingensis TaxID=1241761 RepID=A0A7W9ARK2_9SPHN|nr:glycosyltransferase family 4 protein [Sphingomonas yantingensis]MBB5699309.1 alpha-1,3-mannosyltransferase [Sphingomonas yantingensis]
MQDTPLHMPDARPLAITHVVRQFHPGIGGMEECVLQLARYQVAGGHRVRVVTLDTIFDDPAARKLPHAEMLDGIEIRRVPWRGSKRYPLAPGVLGVLGTPDLVHVHGVDFLSDYLALTQPVHRRILILSTHGGFFHTPFAGRMKLLYFNSITRALLTRYAGVAASSQSDFERFAQIRHRNLDLIENGVTVDKFRGLARRDARTILYFGRLAPNKGLAALVAWFAALVAADPDWRLIVAGRPMGVTLESLRAQAAALGIAERVETVDTPSDAQIATLIGRSSVYASASTYEGFGLAAIEGASAHLYPLLNDIPPFRRTVDGLGFGRIVDFADPATAPAFARDWPSLTMPDAATIDATVTGRFGWRGHVDAFEALYRRALASRGR